MTTSAYQFVQETCARIDALESSLSDVIKEASKVALHRINHPVPENFCVDSYNFSNYGVRIRYMAPLVVKGKTVPGEFIKEILLIPEDFSNLEVTPE